MLLSPIEREGVVLAPASIQEMASLTSLAFDVGDRYRIPVMILADGALGQMMEPVDFDGIGCGDMPEKPWAVCGHEDRRKKNIINSLFIEPEDLEKVVNERFLCYAEIEKNETRYEEYMTGDAEICIVAYGITSRICKTAINQARKNGIKAGMLRPITLWPYPKAVLASLADRVDRFLVVELNMGQMTDDVKVATNCKKPVDFFGRTGGMLPTPEDVLKQIRKLAAGGAK
jgi:2-oxoglutarate ferredoxin oxidoreductase subunit alpha